MKKAFTLLEIIISITILTIMMIFLYKVLSQTRISNEKLEFTQKNLFLDNKINKIFMEDILELNTNPKISKDKNENSVVTLSTKNTYHNPYFNYVTYFTTNKVLYRLESKIEFTKLKETNFYEEDLYYIDILAKNIKKFTVIENKNNIIFFINDNLVNNTNLSK